MSSQIELIYKNCLCRQAQVIPCGTCDIKIKELQKGNNMKPELNMRETEFLNVCKSYHIIDSLELAHIFSQCAHESNNFTKFEENLNYSTDALLKLFPKRVSPDQAELYGRNSNHPAHVEHIGNLIYDNNKDLGNGKNEGYKYRGRGVIQCTGKYNYTEFTKWVKQEVGIDADFVECPELINTGNCKYLTGIWFWKTKKLKQYAMIDDIISVTKRINGGTIGLEDREKKLIHYKKLFTVL